MRNACWPFRLGWFWAPQLTAAPKVEHRRGLPPFTVQDMVRLERISELAASPDGKRVAYTLRTTDMDANKGRTSIWLVETGKRADARGAHRSRREFQRRRVERRRTLRLLSVESQRHQPGVAGRSGRACAPQRAASSDDAPGADALQITDLPLDVGSFRVSPKATASW